MNETIRTLLKRRSIRSYMPQPLSAEEIATILEAGQYAPSGMNRQPWHFSVVLRPEMLARINEACRTFLLSSDNPAFAERARADNFSIFYQAPALVIVSGDETVMTCTEDCSLALGNMFLAAAALDIGSCWIHAVVHTLTTPDSQPLRQELGIPDGYVVHGSGAFGRYTGQTPDAAPRRKGNITIIQ